MNKRRDQTSVLQNPRCQPIHVTIPNKITGLFHSKYFLERSRAKSSYSSQVPKCAEKANLYITFNGCK